MRKIKTKPFDLQKALNGAPVVTRDGHRVEIGSYNPKTRFGLEFKLNSHPIFLTADSKGNYFYFESTFDLFLLDEETQEGGEI